MRVRAGWTCGLLIALALLTGCASKLPSASASRDGFWHGRLSLKVYSKPVQALTAEFELQGSPAEGALDLTSSLGTTLAHMQWTTLQATLRANGEVKTFESLQAMALELTGTELPIASLFAWLQGIAEKAPGWEADLQNLSQGRLSARRVDGVQAELKIILEQ